MAKIETLVDVPAVAPLNSNNDKITQAFANTLSRDGSAPNGMEANLDMNGRRILNLPDAVSNQEPVTLAQAGEIAGVENPLTQETIGTYLYPETAAETAAAVTIVASYYPPGDVRRYGAVGDGATDDSTAIQSALNTGHAVQLQPVTYKINTGLTWDTDGGVIHANGATITTGADIVGLTIGATGTGNTNIGSKIYGDLYLVNTGASTKQGFLLRQVYEGTFEISTKGWYYGLELAATAAGCVYNNFYFRRMFNNYAAIYLHPTSTGWVNENNFYNGRFFIESGQGTKGYFVYMPDSGSTYGQPDDNKFYNPSFELPSGITMSALYLDGGQQNMLFSPRVEINAGATITPGDAYQIHITSDAVGATVIVPYQTYQGENAHQMVTDDGRESQIWTRDRLKLVSRQASPASTALEVWREDGNNDGHPVAQLVDSYDLSQASMGLLLRLARSNISGDYSVRGEDMGTIRLGADDRCYECILSHTSAADDEPGVGVNWETYWRRLPTRTSTSTAWAVSTGYTGKFTRWEIRALGDADLRTMTLREAAAATDSGDVQFGTSTQTTVGSAGAASALPATPSGYLKFYIGTTQYVLPYYAQA